MTHTPNAIGLAIALALPGWAGAQPERLDTRTFADAGSAADIKSAPALAEGVQTSRQPNASRTAASGETAASGPEADSLALVVASLATMGWVMRRRRKD